VISDVELPWGPLVSAGAVLAHVGRAAVNGASLVLILLLADVPVSEQRATAGIVNDHVLEVSDTPEVGHLGASKPREILVTDTWRAEVVALDISVSVAVEVHGSKGSKGSTEGVSGGFNFCSWVSGLQMLDLVKNLAQSSLLSTVETSVNVAVAIGVCGVRGLGGIEVGDPVENGFRATEDNVDRVV